MMFTVYTPQEFSRARAAAETGDDIVIAYEAPNAPTAYSEVVLVRDGRQICIDVWPYDGSTP